MCQEIIDFFPNGLNSNLFSGVIGAIIGFYGSICVFWYSNYISHRRKLIDKLKLLRYNIYQEFRISPDSYKASWKDSLKGVCKHTNAFLDYAPFWQRNRIRKRWIEYRGIKEEIENQAIEKDIFYESETAPESIDDFRHRIDSFLKAL